MPTRIGRNEGKGPHQLQTEAPPARLALPASPRPARHFCPTADKISPSLASLPAAPRPYREIATSPTVTRITPVPVSLQLPCGPARDFQRQSDPPTLRQTARYEEYLIPADLPRSSQPLQLH
ncbi:hypothetical protein ElyMa_004839100 [Elysia marginata]|uniref:Uncharacterized protein n=1 Tax=Elysia marginata TaxID=1093978 RepID=A0AAV4INX2_9GAST|nr:hypothetical protein ElyMa_004839100 [Elysia marginata]